MNESAEFMCSFCGKSHHSVVTERDKLRARIDGAVERIPALDYEEYHFDACRDVRGLFGKGDYAQCRMCNGSGRLYLTAKEERNA